MIKKHKSKLGLRYILFFIVLGAFIAGGLYSYYLYNKVFLSNVHIKNGTSNELFIPSKPTFDDLIIVLKLSGVVTNIDDFIWVAKRKSFNTPRGGRYILKDGMSNNDLVNLLRSGKQSPVNVTFNNIRTHEDLAGQLSRRLESDSIAFLDILKDSDFLSTIGFETHTVLGMILPNTYELFWTTTPQAFLTRMHAEYNRFWNNDRIEKASAIGLTAIEVATLASIVDEETIKADEKPRVAGLYLNRLRINMRLQADPTIKFVLGDFTVNRILNKDLEIDSPYNTYKYSGLPPGPIRMPSISGIEAVLNHEKHQFLYMCAKDDFSGYHAFARTLQQHNINANKYRQALNRNRIYR